MMYTDKLAAIRQWAESKGITLQPRPITERQREIYRAYMLRETEFPKLAKTGVTT